MDKIRTDNTFQESCNLHNNNCSCFDNNINYDDYHIIDLDFVKKNSLVTLKFNLDEYLNKKHINEINEYYENLQE